MRKTLSLCIVLMAMVLSPLPGCTATTLELVENTSTGIKNARYTGTLPDGTVLAFNSYSSPYLVGVISGARTVNIPDSVIYNGNRYAVSSFSSYYPIDMSQAPNTDALALPATFRDMGTMPDQVKYLHLAKYFSTNASGILEKLEVVYVPKDDLATFHGATSWARYVMIIEEGKEPLSLTVEATGVNDLAQKVLLQADSMFTKVNYLTITGTPTEVDLKQIRNMTQLKALDISGATVTDLPSSFCEYLCLLKDVKLPPTLNTIGDKAFYYCWALDNIIMPTTKSIGSDAFYKSGIRHISLPSEISEIGYNAFSYTPLESITLPSELKAIADNTFNHCDSLKSVVVSDSVKTIGSNAFAYTALRSVSMPYVTSIGSYAFSYCRNLENVDMPRLESVNSHAFSYCDSLRELTFPSTLNYKNGTVVYSCPNIRKITFNALQVPYGGDDYFVEYGDFGHLSVNVPAVSVNYYRTNKMFENIIYVNPTYEKMSDVTISDKITISGNTSFDDHCNLTIGFYAPSRTYTSRTGKLTYNGTDTLSLGTFLINDEMEKHASLIAEGPIRADKVAMQQYFESNTWKFVAFPFDVDCSQITMQDSVPFVIRQYNGAKRSYNSPKACWEDLTTDSVMSANRGYIIISKSDNKLTFPAVDNYNKNNIFATDNIDIQLNEYTAELSQYRSWNLIGNPYPCYFDSRFMDFAAPITVWEPANSYSYHYAVYSPVDDDYVLRPAEAFFVQRPLEQGTITFDTRGRQTSDTVRVLSAKPFMAKAWDNGSRRLFNLTLSDGNSSDRTRFVINDNAATAYELDKDAAKMEPFEMNLPLLYTVEQGVHYAINERPAGNGIISLGYYAPADGMLTLTMKESDTGMTITDTETGLTTAFNGSYTFHANAGHNDNRLTLSLAGATGISQVTDNAVNGKVTVYTTDGKLVGSYNEGQMLGLAKGIYVIKQGNKNRKIVVK